MDSIVIRGDGTILWDWVSGEGSPSGMVCLICDDFDTLDSGIMAAHLNEKHPAELTFFKLIGKDEIKELGR